MPSVASIAAGALLMAASVGGVALPPTEVSVDTVVPAVQEAPEDPGFAHKGTCPTLAAGIWTGEGDTKVKEWKIAGMMTPSGDFMYLAHDEIHWDRTYTWKGEYWSWEEDSRGGEDSHDYYHYKATIVQHIDEDGVKRDVQSCEKGRISKKHWYYFGNWAANSTQCPETEADADYTGEFKRVKGSPRSLTATFFDAVFDSDIVKSLLGAKKETK